MCSLILFVCCSMLYFSQVPGRQTLEWCLIGEKKRRRKDPKHKGYGSGFALSSYNKIPKVSFLSLHFPATFNVINIKCTSSGDKCSLKTSRERQLGLSAVYQMTSTMAWTKALLHRSLYVEMKRGLNLTAPLFSRQSNGQPE